MPPFRLPRRRHESAPDSTQVGSRRRPWLFFGVGRLLGFSDSAARLDGADHHLQPFHLDETVAEGVVKSDLPVADVDNREALIGPVKPQRKRPVTSSLVSAASHVGAPSVPGRGRRSSKILHLLQLFLYGCVGQKFTTPGCKLGAFVASAHVSGCRRRLAT